MNCLLLLFTYVLNGIEARQYTSHFVSARTIILHINPVKRELSVASLN